MSTNTKKAKALDLAITQIDRQFGKGSIMRLGDNQFSQMENVISTGCLSLDVCLLYTSPSPRDLSTSRMPSSA